MTIISPPGKYDPIVKMTAKAQVIPSVLDDPEHAEATSQYREHQDILDALRKHGNFMRSLSSENEEEENLVEHSSPTKKDQTQAKGQGSITDQSVMGLIWKMEKLSLSLSPQEEALTKMNALACSVGTWTNSSKVREMKGELESHNTFKE